MANLEHYLATLGPIAILLGGGFEGQTAVIAGGVMARQQVISPAMAIGAAALGTGLVDYALFILGRSFRHTRFVTRVSAKPAFAKCLDMIERYPVAFILSFRFLYGLRAAGPVAVGVSKVGSNLFGILNAVGAAIWAGVFVALGYAFGPAVMTLMGAMVEHAAPIVLGLAVAAAIAALAFWRWRVWVSENA